MDTRRDPFQWPFSSCRGAMAAMAQAGDIVPCLGDDGMEDLIWGGRIQIECPPYGIHIYIIILIFYIYIYYNSNILYIYICMYIYI